MVPVFVAALLLIQERPRFASVTAGGTHTCAIAVDSAAYCWGSNRYGQLGNGRRESLPSGLPTIGLESYGTAGSLREASPQRVLGTISFQTLAAGDRHTCGLSIDGHAFCWGFGAFGQLGSGHFQDEVRPSPVAGGLRFRMISAGGTHTCAVTLDGVPVCWGGNWHGQLGDGTTRNRPEPTPVAGQMEFRAIAAGGIHSCAVTPAGEAFCWGYAATGRLGTGRLEERDSPIPIQVRTDVKFTAISAWFQSCAISVEGRAYCWGLQDWAMEASPPPGALRPEPLLVPDRVTGIDLGSYHVCLTTSKPELFCFGANTYGQLGSSDSPPGARPIALLGVLMQASAGGNDLSGHTCALLTTGVIYCWGNNRWLQLGQN